MIVSKTNGAAVPLMHILSSPSHPDMELSQGLDLGGRGGGGVN